MAKKLLVEKAMAVAAQGSTLCESTGRPGYIVEAQGTRSGVLMTVKLPATTLDKMNENRRTYRRSIMDSAMNRAKPDFESRSLLSSVNEHPEEPYVTPGQASHIVTEAWCENDGYLWNRWDVLDTHTGRDLAALIEAGASFGVSIRGLGSQDSAGNILDDYEYLGTDCVGQPSAKIRTAPEKLLSQENAAAGAAPAIVESVTKGSAMKNKDEAIRFVREQSILMGSESRIEATRRILNVEQALATCSLAAPDLLEAYSLLNECKDRLENGTLLAEDKQNGKPATDKTPTVEELQETLRRERAAFRAASDKLVSAFRTKRQALESQLTAAQAANTRLKTRVESLSQRVVRNERTLRRERTISRMANGSRLRLHTENSKLRMQYRTAANMAVEGILSTKVAVGEAARLTAQLRGSKKPAAPVVESRAPVVESRVVRTRAERTYTPANTTGTTNIPGFI